MGGCISLAVEIQKKPRKHNQRAPEDVADWEKKRLQSKQTVTTIHSHYNVETTKPKQKSTEKNDKGSINDYSL